MACTGCRSYRVPELNTALVHRTELQCWIGSRYITLKELDEDSYNTLMEFRTIL